MRPRHPGRPPLRSSALPRALVAKLAVGTLQHPNIPRACMGSLAELVQRAQRSLVADQAPGRKVFREILRKVENSEDLDTATRLQKEFHRRFIPLSKYTWSLYVRACLRAGRFERILELVQNPEQFGCKNLIATQALRYTVAKLQDAEALVQLWEALCNAKLLNSVLVSDFVRRACQLEAPAVALRALEESPPSCLRPSHFTAVASQLHRKRQRDSLPKVLDLLKAKGLEPNRGLADLSHGITR